MDKKIYKVTCFGREIEVTEKIYKASYTASESEKRRDRRRKTGRIVVDNENEKVTFVPCKEDSLDRLLENGLEIGDSTMNPELLDTRIMVKNALAILTKKEKYIILEIYYERRTEESLAREFKTTQQNIHKWKCDILAKMHKFLEK